MIEPEKPASCLSRGRFRSSPFSHVRAGCLNVLLESRNHEILSNTNVLECVYRLVHLTYSRNLLSVICSFPVDSCWYRVHTKRPCPGLSVVMTMVSNRLLSGIALEWVGVVPVVCSSRCAISVTNLAISGPSHIPSWQLVWSRSDIASRRVGGSRHFIAMR